MTLVLMLLSGLAATGAIATMVYLFQSRALADESLIQTKMRHLAEAEAECDHLRNTVGQLRQQVQHHRERCGRLRKELRQWRESTPIGGIAPAPPIPWTYGGNADRQSHQVRGGD